MLSNMHDFTYFKGKTNWAYKLVWAMRINERESKHEMNCKQHDYVTSNYPNLYYDLDMNSKFILNLYPTKKQLKWHMYIKVYTQVLLLHSSRDQFHTHKRMTRIAHTKEWVYTSWKQSFTFTQTVKKLRKLITPLISVPCWVK